MKYVDIEGKKRSAPRRNRTFNQRIKSPLLCLVELVAHCKKVARLRGFEPPT